MESNVASAHNQHGMERERIKLLGETNCSELAARLALERGAFITRDRVIQDLYPGIEPDAARNRLRVALSRLRHRDQLRVEANLLALEVPSDYSEFLVLATEADEEPEADPRQELIDRIIEYRRFKAVSSVLDDMAREQGRFFARLPADLPIHHLPPENMPLSALVEAFCAVIRVREELKLPEALVAREEYSIQDKITELLALLQRAHGRILFSDAFVSGSRSELITTFLALLELIKLKTVLVQQPGQFAAIYISTRDGEHGCL